MARTKQTARRGEPPLLLPRDSISEITSKHYRIGQYYFPKYFRRVSERYPQFITLKAGHGYIRDITYYHVLPPPSYTCLVVRRTHPRLHTIGEPSRGSVNDSHNTTDSEISN